MSRFLNRRVVTLMVVLGSVAGGGAVSPAVSTVLTYRFAGEITTTDFPSEFPLGAPVVLEMTVDTDAQMLVGALARFNGVEYRTAGPTPLTVVTADGGVVRSYSSSPQVVGPATGAFSPWIMTLFVRYDAGPTGAPVLEAQPFVFSDLYEGAIGATGMVQAPPPPAAPPLVDLNGDGLGDALLYDPATGAWSRQVSQPGGGFVEVSQGSWAPGWSIQPANFDGDALTDFFLFNTTTGQWFRMLAQGSSFTTQASGDWWPGWERHTIDLDGDGITDLFLYDPATGQWFKCLTTPTGFTYEQGGWNPGWELTPMRLNGDAVGDLFLINRTTGRWFWALGDALGGFTYPMTETWYPGWWLYPGDFNGDGLSDLLLHDPTTGVHVVATTGVSGFVYQQSGWSLGWTPYAADLDADDKDDLFLHGQATGQWFHMKSDGAGSFTNVGGQTWSLGWTLHPSDVNGDGRADIVFYDPLTGVWYQARNLVDGAFAYDSGTWAPGLTVVVRGAQ